MAKPRDYKAEYERRIKRALEKGKTRQQARGHKASEHVFRKPKAPKPSKRKAAKPRPPIDPDAITKARATYITKWAWKRDFEIQDWAVEPDELVAHAKTFGWEWFVTYAATWQAMRDTYIAENKAGAYASRGVGYLQSMAQSVNADDMSWLYYH